MYEVCAAYVASLNDAHSQFFLPTDFQATAVRSRLYDGKPWSISSTVHRAHSQLSDRRRLISVDGKSAADWTRARQV